MKEGIKYNELLKKYLSGNCSDKERISVENWMKQSPDNQAVYDQYKQLWRYTSSDNLNVSINVDKGWEELNRRIKVAESISIDLLEHKPILGKRFIYALTRVAAVFLIAFGLFYIFNSINQQKTESINYVAAEIPEQALQLEDGSKVYLNKGAKITYPESFTENSRKISFEGEAFFEIAHNPDKPFIISSGELEVEVLGTSFNLCTCSEGDEMILYLESGKVRFSSVNTQNGAINEQIILLPGQKGIFNKTNGTVCRSEFENQNYLAWKTGILVFEKTPLSAVFMVLEKTYDLRIISDKSIEGLALTACFDNETQESVFESLHTIFGITYTINDQIVTVN